MGKDSQRWQKQSAWGVHHAQMLFWSAASKSDLEIADLVDVYFPKAIYPQARLMAQYGRKRNFRLKSPVFAAILVQPP